MIITKPDILSVLQSEGIELKQKGNAFWSCCPLHSEKTPSFKVDPQRQTFYCFGCNEYGDVIAFIEKYKGLSFKDAVAYLGISTGKPSIDIQREKFKRKLIKAFRQWEAHYHSELCLLYRTLQKAKSLVKSEADLNDLAPFYHKETTWLEHLEILEGNNDKDKFNLFLEVTENGNGL